MPAVLIRVTNLCRYDILKCVPFSFSQLSFLVLFGFVLKDKKNEIKTPYQSFFSKNIIKQNLARYSK